MMIQTRFGTIQDGTYYKTCKPEHFMFKYTGFGISQSELDIMKENNVKTIIITYLGKSGTIKYTSNIEQWLNSNKTHTFGDKDTQRFLSKNLMKATTQ